MKAEQDAREKTDGTYYEGPEPPDRLSQYVLFFAATNPGATVEAWAVFATKLAQQSYREGYVRGREWRERDLDATLSSAEERREYEWEWNAPQVPTTEEMAAKVGGSVLDDLPDEESRVRYLDALGRLTGTFRVVVSR